MGERADGARRRERGFGLLDGRSGHGSICSYLFVSLGLFVRYGYSKSTRLSSRLVFQKRMFGISRLPSMRAVNDMICRQSVCQRASAEDVGMREIRG